MFSGKKIQSAALKSFVYVSVLWNFFPEMTLGDSPKKPRIRVKAEEVLNAKIISVDFRNDF